MAEIQVVVGGANVAGGPSCTAIIRAFLDPSYNNADLNQGSDIIHNIHLPFSPGMWQEVTLVNGLNTLAVPSGSNYFFLWPNPTNVQTIAMVWVIGDTGVPLNLVAMQVWNLATGQANVYLKTNGQIQNTMIGWL